MVFIEDPRPHSADSYVQTEPHEPVVTSNPLKKLAIVASIAAGVQYGWALQLSLLTPYTQLLGVQHAWVSFVWLCGPISGLVFQPTVGYHSDRCTSRFGRRRPFIVAGAILLSFGVLLIGFAADIGRVLGDSLISGSKPRAVACFVLGFWILDIANNIIQSPCRALLADLSEGNDAMVTIGNALFAFYMAVGNILGYAAGAYLNIYKILPITKTEACDIYCANLKTCFLISILLIAVIITLVCVTVKEERLDPSNLMQYKQGVNGEEEAPSLLTQLSTAIRSISKPMKILYVITALTWVGWFPFILYDTDWMGKEVFGGSPVGDPLQIKMYDQGVREGSLGLIFYVAMLGVVSLFMEPILRYLGSVRRVWGIGNMILAACMGLTFLITKMAEDARQTALNNENGSALIPPPLEVKASYFALFTALGIPQAVTYTIPFALASIYSNNSDTGQGLALGLLNLAIVIPQMLVALISGPLDSLFGSSNLPAFTMGGIAAALGGILAMKMLPGNDSVQ
ncbi:sucrose transport protein SUC8-like isoform X2 [Olea europaea var. sylvestris]|uniref:sucrose transport protein SUC8-like isoform X2 n=1 Tax=Olea europaea var. sylvestris TaxID=158386 RepID=UPI000C1D06C2|nr:sucrose transport protein SUC8-like isoform X2 [Olea europaea var. sylvestris]